MSSKAAASRDQTAKGCRTRHNWTISCPPAANRGEGHGACAPAPRLLAPIRPLAGRSYGSFAAPRCISEATPLIAGFSINVNRSLPTMAWCTAMREFSKAPWPIFRLTVDYLMGMISSVFK
jgi:hypothetical protein